MVSKINKIVYVLIFVSLCMMILGGWMDYSEKNNLDSGRNYGISKHHLWSDGLWLLGFAIVLKLIVQYK